MTSKEKLEFLFWVREFFANHTAIGLEEAIKTEHGVIDKVYLLLNEALLSGDTDDKVKEKFDNFCKETIDNLPEDEAERAFVLGALGICKDVIYEDEEGMKNTKECIENIIKIDEEEQKLLGKLDDLETFKNILEKLK